jgi:predicted nucleic acid-binding protein
VIDELLTLLKMRGEYQRALRLGAGLIAGEIARLVWVVPDDVQEAWTIFQQYQDKGWSFTDCVSRVIMERLAIQTAFAFDEDFRQFGTVIVVP